MVSINIYIQNINEFPFINSLAHSIINCFYLCFTKRIQFEVQMITLNELHFFVFYLYNSGRLIGMEQKFEGMFDVNLT